jgi:hypothetical protein
MEEPMSGEHRFRIGDMDIVDEEVKAKRRAKGLLFFGVLLTIVGGLGRQGSTDSLFALLICIGVLTLISGVIYRLYVAVVY